METSDKQPQYHCGCGCGEATGDPMGDGWILARGLWVCPDCCTTCADCGDLFLGPSGLNENEEPICSTCRDNYLVCSDCGCIVHEDRATAIGSRAICPDCLDSYGTCPNCNELHPFDDMVYDENRDQYYCGLCDRNESVRSYCYVPGWIYHPPLVRSPRGKAILYFGAELEVEATNGKNGEWATVESMGNGFWFCKGDGSLADGFEAVSHPATIDHWRTVDLSWFEFLREAGYRSYNTTTAGMHVHVNRSALSSLTQCKLLRFFRNSHRFILLVSRRRLANLNQWAAIERDDNLTITRKVGNKVGCNRYVALNLTNPATVECRIFRGTLSPESFLRNLEFLNALILYCRQSPMDRLHYGSFLEWIAGPKGKGAIGKQASKALVSWFSDFKGSLGEREEICA